jgi:hypothetical protein
MRLVRENGLSLVLFGLFFGTFWLGQALTGLHANNDDLRRHGRPELGLGEYLTSAHFVEATMENWESEFLQMFAYLWLTSFLFQKGSAESKKLDEKEAVDRDPRKSRHKADAPWPVRRGGFVLWLYERSLCLAFFSLFAVSFVLHAAGGAKEFNDERAEHGESAVTPVEFLGSSRFWFESFQNWQSEFLAIGSMVVLTIFLRQRGSPESKPVDAPHSQTGKD